MREKAWEHHNTSSHHEDGFVGFRIVLQDDIVKINDFQQKKLVKIFEDHEVTFDEVGTWFEELEILEPTSSKQNQGPNDVYMERYSGEENLVENTHDPVQEQQIDEAELFPRACDPKTEPFPKARDPKTEPFPKACDPKTEPSQIAVCRLKSSGHSSRPARSRLATWHLQHQLPGGRQSLWRLCCL